MLTAILAQPESQNQIETDEVENPGDERVVTPHAWLDGHWQVVSGTATTESYSLFLPATFELDLWGRLAHAEDALRNAGMDALSAVREAGAVRFRAIILTYLATFAGLTPMLLERSIQARFLIPMAVSLFGVLFATAITLVPIPCGYLIMDDLQTRAGVHRFALKEQSS